MKNQIADLTGIPEYQLRLILNGKRLEDSRRNIDYGIVNESILHLVLRLKGSGNNVKKNIQKPKEIKLQICDKNPDSIEVLQSEILNLTKDDFSQEFTKSNKELCVFKSNSKVLLIYNKIISEALKVAELCDLSLGEISLSVLNFDKGISHLANNCILPLIMKCLINKNFKEKYYVEGKIFYDGNKKWKEGINDANDNDLINEECNAGFPMHIDDSDLTINLCLGGDFSSSKLVFKDGDIYEHSIGCGIAHSGDFEHSATPCEGGRFNMLLFLKESR